MRDLGSSSKVLLSVNNYHYSRGGAEAVFLQHNRLMEGSGWNVVPFAMHHASNSPSEWDSYFVNELEFGTQYNPVRKLAMASKVVYSVEARRKVGRLISKVRPDICHVHNIYHHISPSILGLVKSRGVPVVMTVHDLKIACPAYKMLTRDGICERCKGGQLSNVVKFRCIKNSLALSAVVYAESKLHRALSTYAKNVDRFIVPSKFYGSKLAEWGFDENRMVHIPNFLDADQYQMRRRVSDYFVYVGRLAPEKGLTTLLTAASQAGVRLKIVGAGPEEAHLRAMSERLGGDAEFTGHLSGCELRAAVENARALVLPSEWYENAPVSVLEAYAAGVPVVGADIGGIPEMIEPGETGLVFRSGDPPSLAGALTRMNDMTDGEILQMGEAGRQLVEERFSKSLYLERVLEVYGDL